MFEAVISLTIFSISVYVILYHCDVHCILSMCRDPQLFQYMQQTCDLVGSLIHELPRVELKGEIVKHLRYTHCGAQGAYPR